MNTRKQTHKLQSSTPDLARKSGRTGDTLHLGWRIAVSLIVLVILWLMGVMHSQAQGNQRLVLAHYYTWFDENTWTYDKLSDLPAQPYVSRDPGVMGRHVEQAQSAGIDAFLVAWYGPAGGSNQTEPNLAAMLNEAGARGFRAGILFETTSPFFAGPGDATAALRHALTVHAAHPAFLRVDGKPVIFFWRPQLWSVDTWRAIRNEVDPNRTSIWIAEGVDMAYQAIFDGHHLYSNTWNPPADLTWTNQKFARWVADARAAYGGYRYWVSTVMPGYNDIRTGRADGFAQDRWGGAYYEGSWQAAIASNPDWIVITSFNEWPEGSYIEPSAAYGDQYLGLTARWSQIYKAGGSGGQVSAAAVAPQETSAPPAPASVPLPQAEPTEPTAFVDVSLLNLRSGPDTSFPVLEMMGQGTALPIIGRDENWPEWWNVVYNGTAGWIFAPMVQTAGPMDQVATVQAPAPIEASSGPDSSTGLETAPGAAPDSFLDTTPAPHLIPVRERAIPR